MKLSAKTTEVLVQRAESERAAIEREFSAYEEKDRERFEKVSELNRARSKARDDYSNYLATQFERFREENSVYRGDYRQETELKSDAVDALGFAAEASAVYHDVIFKKTMDIVSAQFEVIKSTSACTVRPSDGQCYSEQKLNEALNGTEYPERMKRLGEFAKPAIQKEKRKIRLSF